MPRIFPKGALISLLVLASASLASAGLLAANPPALLPPDPEQSLHNTLMVQRAMEQARYYLFEKGNAKKAVEILEEHLPRINGNSLYLRLLRDAYWTYIKDLRLAQQGSLAAKYLERLAILDRDAVNNPALPLGVGRSGVGRAGPSAVAVAPDPKQTTKPAIVRGKLDDDPFDLAYRHNQPPTIGDRQDQVRPFSARQLLARAETEYLQRRFDLALQLYEQAHLVDQAVTADCRQRWAYCKLFRAYDQLKQPDLDGQSLPALQREVRLAIDMAPGLTEAGKRLLREIDQRGQGQGAAVRSQESGIRNQESGVRGGASGEMPLAVKHQGRNAQGWQVAETAHFRIFHNQSRDLVEKAAAIAERTSLEMHRKWFAAEEPAWNPKCDLFLHSTSSEYTRITGVSGQSPGHSRIESDTGGRVVGRRMDLRCDVPGMLDAVLPHETTHVVLAGQFGRHAVPRWADEGMAVLSEPKDKIDQHRRNLIRNQREGQLFNVGELMSLEQYPHARRINAFYAQSVVLVDFLSRQRGPQVFSSFLREGLDRGYEQALQKYYGLRNFNDLQLRWEQYLRAELEPARAAVAGR